jgi:SsrA-binding protein
MSTPEVHNKKAGRDYAVLESLETGIELTGTEVKSLRTSQASLEDAYAQIDGRGEAWLHHFHIAPYDKGNRENHEPKRSRKLLLHKEELRRLHEEVATAGKTLVPLKGYFNAQQRFKILLGLCKGKNVRDKRQDLKKRDSDREIRREITRRR